MCNPHLESCFVESKFGLKNNLFRWRSWDVKKQNPCFDASFFSSETTKNLRLTAATIVPNLDVMWVYCFELNKGLIPGSVKMSNYVYHQSAWV